VLVDRRGARLASRRPGDHLATAHALDHQPQVLGRRAAAAADEAEAVLAGERVVGVGELLRGERVERAPGGQHGQSGVGHARDADLRVPRQVAQVLAHLGRARGAVEADHVDAERL